MTAKKLKYKQYLENFPNCPPIHFKEIKRSAYRWTHNPLILNDFMPVNLINKPPQRMLDDDDKMCMAYGLSMFDTLENASAKYEKQYKAKRLHQKEQFKEDKGNCIAELALTTEDGVADVPNERNFGHFTFHEYAEISIATKIFNLFNIFDENGTFNSQ